MGSLKKTLAKKKEKKEQKKAITPLEDKMKEYLAEEKYEQALSIGAELIQSGERNASLLYDIAWSYFKTRDYERAAKWVDNTLQQDTRHVEARILLARICMIQNRMKDGMAVYRYLYDNCYTMLNEVQRDTIKDMLVACEKM